MALIDNLLEQILQARYGRDVRQSIHDAIEEINNVNEANIGTVQAIADTAQGFADDAEQAVTDAEAQVTLANTARTGAQTAQTGAETAEDNAEHWYQETLAISQTLANAIIARGTVAFADLPSVSSTAVKDGFMYNISDNFTTTSDFVEGAGINIPMGANVYKVTINNVPKWDILAGSSAAVFVGTEAQIAQADAQGLISENTMIISLDGEAPYELTSSMILHGNDSVENVLDDIDDEITEINTALNGFYVVERTYYVNAQSDGVKTFSGMLDELKTKLNTWCDTNLNDDDFITIDYLSMPGTTTLGVRYDAELNKSNISIRDIPLFGASVESGHVFYAWYVMLKTSGSTAYNGDVTTSNTVVANNASTSVVPAGRKYALAFKKYRKISIS